MLVKIVNGEPVTYPLRQLRADNPDVSFPAEPSAETLAQFGVYHAEIADAPPSRLHVETHRLAFISNGRALISREWAVRPITPQDVWAERDRRLALGFDYDFGDERGVHHIGTTKADLEGWDEVTELASAAIALGQPSAQVAIATNTGACIVTAMEWQSILIAAGQARQPIWAASFALQAMDPIPADFENDAYWTVG
jgi:hypothetical protein